MIEMDVVVSQRGLTHFSLETRRRWVEGGLGWGVCVGGGGVGGGGNSEFCLLHRLGLFVSGLEF